MKAVFGSDTNLQNFIDAAENRLGYRLEAPITDRSIALDGSDELQELAIEMDGMLLWDDK